VELLRRCNIIDYSLLIGIATANHPIKRKQGFVVFSEADDGGMLSEDGDELYFMGIIDILTNYGARKKLEHLFKTSFHKKAEVSCAPPDYYAQRFLEFMDRIIE
jgi:1-phosphatidylinositol-4-phosphate 5-kinase